MRRRCFPPPVWAPGDSFKTGEVLYEVETEKVNQEVEAPGDGKLLEIKVPEGETAKVDEVVCVVESE